MKNMLVTTVNSGMVGNGATVTAENNVARLRGHNPVKTNGWQIVQIQVLPVPPPVILADKVRQLNTGQRIRIPEQGVTVSDAVFKNASR